MWDGHKAGVMTLLPLDNNLSMQALQSIPQPQTEKLIGEMHSGGFKK